MILPDDVVAALVEKLTDNKDDLKIKKAVSGSEDITVDGLTPPYCVVFSEFGDEAEIAISGHPSNIPVNINILCTSGEHKTVEASSTEAMLLAIQVIKLVVGDYNVTSLLVEEPLLIKCKSVPLTFGVKSAAITSVICHFQYEINLIY